MLDDWTAMVTTVPTSMPTSPDLARAALSDRSMRSATSTFMLRVMSDSAT